jgi:putative endonuclease
MPFYVYVLYSSKLDKTYVGFTSNLAARVTSHNVGIKGWTVRGRPWILIYYEKFDKKADAIKLEKELKSGKGREYIRNVILKEYFQTRKQ